MRGISRLGSYSGIGKAIPAMVFSAFFLSSCSLFSAGREPSAPHRINRESGGETQAENRRLFSYWERGICSLSSSSVTYTDIFENRQSALRLDAEAEKPERILCSGDHTVIFTPGAAVITLGGYPVLEGREMLGIIGERFLIANSYSINISDISREDGGRAGERLRGDVLEISAVSGRRWEINLSNPFEGWNIY
jgi:hypothetical protein